MIKINLKLSKEVNILLLFVCCCLFYGNTLFNDYSLDDAIVITQNQFTKKGIEGIPDLFKYESFTGFFGIKKNLVSGGRYRPLSMATFALEYSVFGLNPHISHLINVILFAVASFILFLLLNSLLKHRFNPDKSINIAFIATLFFIAHPVHTEVIANIKGRDEIIALLGALCANLLVIKYIDNKKKVNLFYAFLFFITGLFSKENTITFLAVIPLTIYFFRQEKLRTYIITFLPLAIAAIFFLLIRRSVLGETPPPPKDIMNNPFADGTGSQKFATIFFTFLIYLKLLFFPHPLTFDYYPYHIQLVDWNNPFVLISLITYIALIFIATVMFFKKSMLSFGILYFLITFSIVSNLVFPVGTFMNERFLFMPSVGFVLLLAWFLIEKLPVLVKKKYMIRGVIVTLLLLCFVKTYSRNRVWKDNFTLFTTDVKTSFNSAKSNCSAGGTLLEKANELKDDTLIKQYREQALIYLKRAVAIHPNYFDAVFLLGNAYTENYLFDSALICYKKAYYLRTDQKNSVFSNVEAVMNRTQNVDFKINGYLEFCKIDPDYFIFNYRLGYLYGRYKNDLKQSVYYLEKAVLLNPKDFNVNKDLGVAYGLSGNYLKSAECLEKAIAIDSMDITSYQNLILTYYQLKNFKRIDQLNKKIAEFGIHKN